MAVPAGEDQVVSYERIGTQCTDAEIQFKTPGCPSRRLARFATWPHLLRHSIDSYYEDELHRPTTLHCRQRREAKNALGQLRSAVQVTPYPQSIPGINPKLVAHPGA